MYHISTNQTTKHYEAWKNKFKLIICKGTVTIVFNRSSKYYLGLGDNMNCKTLINLIDEFNDHNIIASLTLNPEKIVFIYEDNKEETDKFRNIKNYLKDKLPDTDVTGVAIDKLNQDKICKELGAYKGSETIVNISGGSKLMSLVVYKASKKYSMESIFIDLDNEEMLRLTNREIIRLDADFINLEVKDFIASTGGKIISDSTELFSDIKAQQYVDYIVKNYEMWNDLKKIIRDSNIIIHNKFMMDTATISLDNLGEYQRRKLKGFLNRLKELNLIHISRVNRNKIIVKFKNIEAKTLLFKTGTWLEVLVYRILREMKEINDVKSGVLFLWDDEVNSVKNEVDVVAICRSRLIYVSCKDTEKYDEDTLNELNVYAEKLGGEDAKKILVATKESYKKSVVRRAEEMGIEIIIFNGNVDSLRKKLNKIIIN